MILPIRKVFMKWWIFLRKNSQQWKKNAKVLGHQAPQSDECLCNRSHTGGLLGKSEGLLKNHQWVEVRQGWINATLLATTWVHPVLLLPVWFSTPYPYTHGVSSAVLPSPCVVSSALRVPIDLSGPWHFRIMIPTVFIPPCPPWKKKKVPRYKMGMLVRWPFSQPWVLRSPAITMSTVLKTVDSVLSKMDQPHF